MKTNLPNDVAIRKTTTFCFPSSGTGLRCISGNPSMLRNMDVGHIIELRERIVALEMENAALRKTNPNSTSA
jgi:hypothetical protein